MGSRLGLRGRLRLCGRLGLGIGQRLHASSCDGRRFGAVESSAIRNSVRDLGSKRGQRRSGRGHDGPSGRGFRGLERGRKGRDGSSRLPLRGCLDDTDGRWIVLLGPLFGIGANADCPGNRIGLVELANEKLLWRRTLTVVYVVVVGLVMVA